MKVRLGFLKGAVFLPCFFVLAIGCLIIPLPAWALDLFLTSNLLFSLFLFVAALQVVGPLKLSTLPTLLLLATLTRLCLNINTTRAILTTGDAGEAVEVFGQVVVQGELVVGIVLFSLITLVQFLVVAKGAERVAEVAARFTLDALPGKQMAIDAELRAGLIDSEAARKRRADLQSESRFYGALDGAMKFVKGDAIAGIVIVIVNIAGGLLVGILLKGYDFTEAIHRYSLLSIGDGLLSQIPSFLNAVAAGLVVTRVQADENASLAEEVSRQVCQLRTARIFISGGAFLLMFIPGMPWFLLLSIGSFLCMSLAIPERKIVSQEAPQAQFVPAKPAVVEIVVSKSLLSRFSDLMKADEIVAQYRKDIFKSLGLLVQSPGLSLRDDHDSTIALIMRGVVIDRVVCTSENQISLEEILKKVKWFIKEHAEEFIDDIMTRQLLELVERDHPDVVSAIVPTLLSVTQITQLLRALVREDIPITQLDVILQAAAEHDQRSGPRTLLANSRACLKRLITDLHAPNGVLKTHLLSPALDAAFSKSEGDEFLPVVVIEGFIEEMKNFEVEILTTTKRSRHTISELLVAAGAKATIVAFDELLPGIEIRNRGTIGSWYEKKDDDGAFLAA